MYTPVNPSFTIYKWGLRGQNYIGMFSWWNNKYMFGPLFHLWNITVKHSDKKKKNKKKKNKKKNNNNKKKQQNKTNNKQS